MHICYVSTLGFFLMESLFSVYTLHGVFPWSVSGHHRPKSVVVFVVHVVILAMLYHTSYISVFVSNQMSKQVCCIMVILTELGGSMPVHHVLNVSGNIGPGSEEVKEVLSSLNYHVCSCSCGGEINPLLEGRS